MKLSPALDKHGFLADRERWDEATALWFAEAEGIVLTGAHWAVLHVLRDAHARSGRLPANPRMFTALLKHALGAELGNSLTLYQLFPQGPLRQSCRLAGLPRPPHCLG